MSHAVASEEVAAMVLGKIMHDDRALMRQLGVRMVVGFERGLKLVLRDGRQAMIVHNEGSSFELEVGSPLSSRLSVVDHRENVEVSDLAQALRLACLPAN